MSGYVVVWSGRGPLPYQRDDDPAWMCRESRLVQMAPGRKGWPTPVEQQRASVMLCRTCQAVLSRRDKQLKCGQCWTCRIRGRR